MIIPDVFVINLDRRSDRWSYFLSQVKNSSIINNNYKRISGIDGSILKDEYFLPYVTSKGCNDILVHKKTKGLYLSRGAIALAMTYYEICQNCIRSTILLEDDIIVSKNFDEIFIKALAELPNDWDVVYLGWCKSSNLKIVQITEHIGNISGQINGTHGWMINPSSAKKILDMFPLKYQIDTEIYLNKKLKKYCTNVPIIHRASVCSTSDIQI